jgi:uncharacterized damage-inducible protein DinB
MNEHFLNLLDYENWATSQWIEFAETASQSANGAQFAAKAEPIIRHIPFAFHVWLDRIEGVTTDADDDIRVYALAQLDRWRRFMAGLDLAESWVATYTDGRPPYRYRYADTLQHICNHGTYHRGQLREMAESMGLTDWPETDFHLFARVLA